MQLRNPKRHSVKEIDIISGCCPVMNTRGGVSHHTSTNSRMIARQGGRKTGSASD
ncbi:hypothetical protein KIN20_026063 [Parelaphostrongylus tenuis]|uniref:Uncharacterized protein n=1 Tax=Parelaphostrongylus tenuis TaxID=148309 RepID=A0AAD5MZ47_PARTN|nr:hypothetical protein KIN20_026063 [Parelaphostrongylus tenuis]